MRAAELPAVPGPLGFSWAVDDMQAMDGARRLAARCAAALQVAAVVSLAPARAAAQERIELDGAWQIAAAVPAEPLRYDKTCVVPGAFEEALGVGFDGVAWLRRSLPLGEAHRGARIRVEFAAAATAARVLVNGVEVGRHLGGWTPFCVELTDHVRCDGSDVLEVELDEKVGHNTQGFLPIIQPHFGGIWQEVTLHVDRVPTIDRTELWSFATFDPKGGGGELEVRVPWRAGCGTVEGRAPASIEVEVFDGERSLAKQVERIAEDAGLAGFAARERSGEGLALPDGSVEARLALSSVEPWAPGRARLYRLRVRLLDAAGAPSDQVERAVGFRSLAAVGTTILWNGAPLQVRGLLHWGYSPPFLAPPVERAWWRRQLLELKGLGFNTLKCCLWVPPSCVYELCDELGILVWQEYPTWHPRMDEAHREELRREYQEFFAHDGSHPSVAFRSITCETGHGAELHVVKELYEACKAAVPDTLVVDDSSWIGWQRITDFWDEHPYGNHRWWPRRLADFARHQEEKGRKPLLLGECMAGDTWVDRAAWDAQWGAEEKASGKKWWRPDCYEAQAKFEEWLTQECGAETVASLLPTSLATALEARKYQIETLRATLPDAGYVVSVARDFAKARMGLYDDFGRFKWDGSEWDWHGDVMLSLRTEGERRAFVGFTQLPIVASSFAMDMHPASTGEAALHASVDDQREAHSIEFLQGASRFPLVRGRASPPIELRLEPLPTDAPTARRVNVSLTDVVDDTKFHRGHPVFFLASNSWRLWQLPSFSDTLPPSVREVDHLDAATLDFLEQGGRVLLRVAGAKRTFKSEGMWWLRGAPFTPPHPVHETVPAEMLRELQPFDLDGERVMPWTVLRGQVDPILAFWETHDIPEVRAHLFAFDTRVGKGRLLASCLDTQSDAGRYVRAAFARHLAEGPAPRRELASATIAALRGLFDEQCLELPTWRFAMDPQDQGLAAGYAKPTFDVAAWRTMPAGSHWENHGDDVKHYTGIAWYRVDFELSQAWAGLPARAVFEGIDDSAIVWLDGREVGRFGDPATQTTIWLEPQTAELGPLAPGRHTLTLRVVDHGGAGGLWKPVHLTTGPSGDLRELLE